MKTIDLSKVEVTNIDKSKSVVDFSKTIAQVIFQNTQLIPEHNFALKLYENSVVEFTEDNVKMIREYAKRFFVAYAYLAIERLLKDADN
ncbi:MAG TPA: hypothetical protein DDW85_00630 [Porphyromonadaceae bacterium]|nr:hypothetical protein [Porphyromonadaceae bacterium]